MTFDDELFISVVFQIYGAWNEILFSNLVTLKQTSKSTICKWPPPPPPIETFLVETFDWRNRIIISLFWSKTSYSLVNTFNFHQTVIPLCIKLPCINWTLLPSLLFNLHTHVFFSWMNKYISKILFIKCSNSYSINLWALFVLAFKATDKTWIYTVSSKRRLERIIKRIIIIRRRL